VSREAFVLCQGLVAGLPFVLFLEPEGRCCVWFGEDFFFVGTNLAVVIVVAILLIG